MATQKPNEKELVSQEKVIETVSKTEQFFRENKKTIYGIVIGIIAVGLLIYCYNQFIYKPKAEEGAAQMIQAEQNFRNGDYELALNGDGNVLGFAQIADEFGTKAGKSVYFYSGVCALNTGDYEKALDYLKKYNGKDNILASRAIACMGDAYVGLEDLNAALGCFEKAAAKADNVFAATYLLKAGITCEELGNKQKALGFYKQIKEEYPSSIEGYDIDKYISRIENQE